MAVLNTVLLVLFIIVSILLVLLVLIQNEEGDSLGGVFAGGGGSAFGSRSGNVFTRISSVLGGLFLALALTMALLTRSSEGSGVEAAGRALNPTNTEGSWWQESEASSDGASTEGASSETAPLETEDAGVSSEEE